MLKDVALVASVDGDAMLTLGKGEPFRTSNSLVTGAFFDVLGARPLLGRTFRADDDRPTSAKLMVISYALRQRQFSADPQVIGRRVRIAEGQETESAEIVGVMPPEFFFPRDAEYWTPATPFLARAAARLNATVDQALDTIGVFQAVARLAAGAGIDAVQAQSVPYFEYQKQKLGIDTTKARLNVTVLGDYIFGPAGRALLWLRAAVVIVLLLACANVAGLLLARGVERTREIAVRVALGATRGPIVREQLFESGVLAVAGASLGVALAAVSEKNRGTRGR